MKRFITVMFEFSFFVKINRHVDAIPTHRGYQYMQIHPSPTPIPLPTLIQCTSVCVVFHAQSTYMWPALGKSTFWAQKLFRETHGNDEFFPLGGNCIICTVKNFSISPTFSWKSELHPLLLALTAILQRRTVRVPHVYNEWVLNRKLECNARYLEYTGSQGLQCFRS